MSLQPDFQNFDTRESASARVAELASTSLQRAIQSHREASIMLSGGNTPGRSMELLSQASLDWQKVTAGLVDERFVAPNEEGSNEQLVRSTLLQNAARSAKFISMFHENASLKESAQIANDSYKHVSPITFVLLGMGSDGHTASWFPGTDHLETALTSEESVIAVDSNDVSGARNFRYRLTLTKSALASSQDAVLLLFGEEKKRVYLESLHMTPQERPIKAAIEALGAKLTVIWAP